MKKPVSKWEVLEQSLSRDLACVAAQIRVAPSDAVRQNLLAKERLLMQLFAQVSSKTLPF